MKELSRYTGIAWDFMRKFAPIVLIGLALVLFGLSFSSLSYQIKLDREISKVQSQLHKRQKIIEQYSQRAAESKDDFVSFDDLPEDMVIYCYKNDTLKSWTHQFPISNDEIKAFSFGYRLQSTGERNQNFAPLAYIGSKEQYANLGSAWYIVNTRFSGDFSKKIVSGILVRTDYPSGYLENEVNKHLHIGKGFTTIDINNDDSAIVYGRGGEPLFSIVSETPSAFASSSSPLAWVSFLLCIVAVFIYHLTKKNWRSFWLVIAVLVIVRIVSLIYVNALGDSGDLFSPIFYADNDFFNSLGNLLINSTILSLAIYAFFSQRNDIFKRLKKAGKYARIFTRISIGVAVLFLLGYIYFTLRSLVINSNIVLEPFRLADLSFHSFLCFFCYAMLALALLQLIQLLFLFSERWKHVSMFALRPNILFVSLFSLFFVVSIGFNSLSREFETNKVRTGKIAIERDLSMELALIDIDSQIENDTYIAILTSVKAMELIRNRLLDRYFTGDLVQKYNIELTLCTPDNLLDLMTGSEPVGCFQFYDDLVSEYGSPLFEGSHFFFINNFDGKTTYLGVFPFLSSNDNTISRLFIKFTSRYQNSSDSTPLERLGLQAPSTSFLPSDYSYARYVNGRLVSSGGFFNYPVSLLHNYKKGYSITKSKGYLHFVDYLSEDEIVIISRQQRPFLNYVISFSYLFLFFGLFITLFTRWGRSSRWIILPKHSVRRKITLLITGTMMVALLSMGFASVVYVAKLNKSNIQNNTEERLSLVRNALSEHCKYALRYSQVVTPEMLAAVDEVSGINDCDINLFDTKGVLIVSTKSELYNQFIISKRMNNKAYDAIIRERSGQYITVESIGGMSYYSLYAPLFNADGEMVAIVNVPYSSRNMDVNYQAVSTISAVINLYLILLLAALLLGYFVSNSMVRPLSEIKRKIEKLALPGNRNRHIKYRNSKDELGVLIESYNRMVDDLEESTRRLARQEREQAWKEMARQIAHEIKNPLTPMRLSIQYLLRLKSENVPGWEEKLEKISHSLIEQIDTLSNTANEFSSFSKYFTEDVTYVDIDALIREQAILFDNRDSISIRYLQNTENAVIQTRRNQLSRVFVNLITNSIQAIENSGQEIGHIKITLSEIMDGEIKRYKIDFEDNGPGVSEENLPKLFTPNFTTKSGGTGLGLAICKSIIDQNQGSISYSRSSLGGACFTILLTP